MISFPCFLSQWTHFLTLKWYTVVCLSPWTRSMWISLPEIQQHIGGKHSIRNLAINTSAIVCPWIIVCVLPNISHIFQRVPTCFNIFQHFPITLCVLPRLVTSSEMFPFLFPPFLSLSLQDLATQTPSFQDAWAKCLVKNPQTKFISVWTDAGYRTPRGRDWMLGKAEWGIEATRFFWGIWI